MFPSVGKTIYMAEFGMLVKSEIISKEKIESELTSSTLTIPDSLPYRLKLL